MLPAEIFIEIAIKSANAWNSMLAIPSFGRFTLTSYGKQVAFKTFGRIDDNSKRIIYYMNNKKHRKNGPAIVYKDGLQGWFINDNLHREDGPAVNNSNDDHLWFLNNQFHKIDGPAVIYKHGTQKWYVNGKRHRIDGPAIIHSNGYQEWFLDGKQVYP